MERLCVDWQLTTEQLATVFALRLGLFTIVA